MTIAFRLFCLAAFLAALIFLAVSPLRAEMRYEEKCPSFLGLSVTETEPVPILRFRTLMNSFILHRDKKVSLEEVVTAVESFALRYCDKLVEEHLRYARADRSLHPDFLKLFEEKVAWAREIKSLSPDDMFDYAVTLAAEMGLSLEQVEQWFKLGGRIPMEIYFLANGRGSKKLIYTGALRELARPNGRHRSAWLDLERLARSGHKEATKQLVRRFMEGDALPRRLDHALHWALVGQDLGIDYNAEIASLRSALTAQEIAAVNQWLHQGYTPWLTFSQP